MATLMCDCMRNSLTQNSDEWEDRRMNEYANGIFEDRFMFNNTSANIFEHASLRLSMCAHWAEHNFCTNFQLEY